LARKPKWVAVVLVATCAGTAAIGGLLYALGSADVATQDRQPIAFSHERHAGQLQISCLYCHRHAEVSQAAGIPSMQLCMSCHGAMPNNGPESRKLLAYWNEQRPVEWVRLQRLPDFVYFTHEMHLDAGLRCADCHGVVDAMAHTPRATTYEMGWCLTCHQQRAASEDCWTCHK
jgi:hypothetical protein